MFLIAMENYSNIKWLDEYCYWKNRKDFNWCSFKRARSNERKMYISIICFNLLNLSQYPHMWRNMSNRNLMKKENWRSSKFERLIIMIIRFKIKKERDVEGADDEENDNEVITFNEYINSKIRLNWSCHQDY